METAEDRAKVVEQTNASLALEGMYPDDADKEIQQRYINGDATIADLLAHARRFASPATES